MRILLTVGHSKLKNGCYTSADGTRYGGGNEYIFNKSFSKYVKAALEAKGHEVDRIVCPEGVFTGWKDERKYKLAIERETRYDLCIELHLNSFTPASEGCEVLYVSAKGKKYAERVQKQLSKVFINRGVKKRTDLYMLNETRCPCILLETFFCTNRKEWEYAIKNKKKLAELIAKAI